MLNQITLMGRLTRDPELRYTPNGVAVVSFSLAVDRDFQSRDGGEKKTDFIDITAWRHTAEFVSKYFAKGSMAIVCGRLQIRDWTDKEGNKRRSAEVVAENIYFGESKRAREGGEYGGQSAAPPQNYGGGNQGGYSQGSSNQGGGYNSNQGGGYEPPASSGGFAELDDGDGELPF